MPSTVKVNFLVKKYIVLLFEASRTVIHPERKTKIFGQEYFYDDKLGLAVLQGTFIDNAFLRTFIPQNGIIVDVGANIGQFNLFSKYFLKARKVYSFEPIEETYKILKKNCPRNSYMTAISTKKKLKMYVAVLSVWSSAYLENPTDKVEMVRTQKIDDILEIKKEKIIELLKVDTEGTELDVLKASSETLHRSQYILVEVQFMHLTNGKLSRILEFLESEIKGVILIRIGRVYNSPIDYTTGSADMLFFNPNVQR
ncbi:MAG TPA: FkbM family methyltransferase [Patescibacteria group bacterium]|nr:FkbM family methyltransferase [Patescibacteria group bacterium]